MKLSIGRKLMTAGGEVMKENPDKDSKEVTIGLICGMVLVGDIIDDSSKHSRYKLWQKVNSTASEEIDITSEEITIIKRLLEKSKLNVIAVGQAIDILEGN
jgi:hypothetical protein